MKQILIALGFILAFNYVNAQQTYYEDGTIRFIGNAFSGPNATTSDKHNNEIKRNAIKMNVSSLLSKNIELQFERAITTKLSLALTGSFKPESTLPGTKNAANAFSDTLNIFSQITTSTWAVMPEARWYFRQSMKGMYLGFYGRIKGNTFNFPLSYVDDLNTKQTITVKGDAMSFGGGLLLGSHFQIKKSISLDWYLAGVHYTNSAFELKGSSTAVTLSPTDQQDVRDFINGAKPILDFFVNDLTNDVTSNSVTIKGNMNGIGFRGGLCLGFRF